MVIVGFACVPGSGETENAQSKIENAARRVENAFLVMEGSLGYAGIGCQAGYISLDESSVSRVFSPPVIIIRKICVLPPRAVV